MTDSEESSPDPQSSDHDLRDDLALSMVTGVGPLLQANLLRQFGTAKKVFDQGVESLLSVNGIGPQVASRIVGGPTRGDAEIALAECRRLNVSLLRKSTPEYPDSLSRVEDAPNLLYVRGEIAAQDDLAIGIVGSRRCTVYGRRQAERLASGLVRAGFCVVSGLARGIDAAAHQGALRAGGRTIAVMATGVKRIYPPEHADLALEISNNGAVVSEFPLDQSPSPGLFPQRNRIISGLSLGVVVIEATRKSGALHTARHAMEQGREVFAVPGNVDSIASEGCHDLIRDGVTLIRSVDDILEGLGPLARPTRMPDDTEIRDPRELSLNQQELEILACIGSSPVSVDEIIQQTELNLSRILSTLTVLEMKRFVRRLPGNLLIRSH